MTPPTRPVRVCIVDDHPIVRQGIRSLLAEHPDLQLVCEAEGTVSLFGFMPEGRPDVVLLDIRLPNQSGIEIIARLKREYPNVRVIILTSYDEDEFLYAALRAGADGYLLKSAAPEMLAQAIRQVAAGERLLTPALVDKLMRGFQEIAQAQVRSESGLSGQELEVLRMIAAGATNREIAEKLYWSEVTVKRKVQDILEKLGANNRAQAVADALRRGLL